MNAQINLIPRYRIAARLRARALRRWAQGGSVLALVLIGAAVFFQTRWAQDPQAMAAELAQAVTRTEDTSKRLKRLEAELLATQRRVDANRAVTNQPDYAVLLALMARTLDEQVVLRACGFEAMTFDLKPGETTKAADARQNTRPEGFEVHTAGYAQSQRAVSDYVLRLERTGLFHEVRLLSTRREPVPFGDGEAIAFEVRCYLATGMPMKEPGHE